MMSQDQINELTRAVGRIEGKLDAALQSADSSEARQVRLGARVAKLEEWRSYTLGGFAVFSIVVGALWTLVLHGR